MSPKRIVFVVDDDVSVRRSLCRLLKSAGHEAEPYGSADAFLDEADLGRPGCVILDIHMPGMNGTELQDTLTQRECLLPIIFITGHADIPTSVEAMRKGAVTFLPKPFDAAALLEAVDKAVAQNRARHEQ